jgi:hypothetical protein
MGATPYRILGFPLLIRHWSSVIGKETVIRHWSFVIGKGDKITAGNETLHDVNARAGFPNDQ